MKILLVGGTGVLSSAVTEESLKQGIKVTMINRGRHKIPDGIELIKADKDDLEEISKKLCGRSFDAVIDFLCFTDEQTSKSFKFYSQYTKQYFFISSCAVYDTRQKGISDEDFPKVNPVWQYSIDKWASEENLRNLQKGSDTEITIIRPSVTYDNTRIPYGVVPLYGYHWTLAARILAGKPIITWNDGKNRCNMTRVEDFAVGVVGLIGNPKAYGEAFNVCGDETPSFREVLDAVSDYLEKDVITLDVSSDFYAEALPSKAGEILGGRAEDGINSNKKIKVFVPSFRQKIFMKEGVFKTLDAYKENNYYSGIDWCFDAETDRIINKWCKSRRISSKQYNTHFVDYLDNASFNDKLKYFLIKHSNNFIVKTILTFVIKYKQKL
jgi:nucleoside-diphosphate-sugar epimerase